MKKYISCAYNRFISVEDRISAFQDGILGDLDLLAEVLQDLAVGTIITMEAKTYAGSRYNGTIQINKNDCTINLTFKGRPDPQQTISFADTAYEMRSLYRAAQGRDRCRFYVTVEHPEGYPDEFSV